MSINLSKSSRPDTTGIDSILESNHLLVLILNELRIMNAYNAMAHDEVLTTEDLEDEHNANFGS